MTKEQEFRKQTEEAKFEAFSVMCEKVNDLEKENAELKEQCSILDKSLVTSTKNNIERQKIIDEIKEQLTEAKEIIEELYNIIPASMADYAKEPMEHARKFMTEEADE